MVLINPGGGAVYWDSLPSSISEKDRLEEKLRDNYEPSPKEIANASDAGGRLYDPSLDPFTLRVYSKLKSGDVEITNEDVDMLLAVLLERTNDLQEGYASRLVQFFSSETNDEVNRAYWPEGSWSEESASSVISASMLEAIVDANEKKGGHLMVAGEIDGKEVIDPEEFLKQAKARAFELMLRLAGTDFHPISLEEEDPTQTSLAIFELQDAGINIKGKCSRPAHLPMGRLGDFPLVRGRSSWFSNGDIPIDVAQALRAHPIGKRGLKVGSYWHGAPLEFAKDPLPEFIEKCEIQTLEGLRLFTDTLRQHGLA